MEQWISSDDKNFCMDVLSDRVVSLQIREAVQGKADNVKKLQQPGATDFWLNVQEYLMEDGLVLATTAAAAATSTAGSRGFH